VNTRVGYLSSTIVLPGLAAIYFLAEVCLADTNPPIAIGLFLPPDETEAAGLRQGAELAAAHAKKEFGLTVELIARGRTGQWGAESDEAAQMVLDEKVRGLIAPASGPTSHLLLQVAGRTRIPVVSLSSDSSVTAARIPWLAQIMPENGQEARCLLAGAEGGVYCHASRWAAFVMPGRTGRQATADLKQAAELSGIRLNPLLEISDQLADFTNGVRRFFETGADGVLLWVDPRLAGKIALALREGGFVGAIAGHSRLRSGAFTKAAGKAAEGVFVPGIVLDAESVPVQARLQKETKTGVPPDMTLAAAYDAARLLIEHLRRCGNRPGFQDFPLSAGLAGATGRLKFDAIGRREAQLELYACRAGRFEPLTKGKP
jgi:ABC-type branched-subunit amino acid transport system substrate-binding protein